MKIMQLVLHKLEEDTLKETRQNIYHQSFSILMNSKKVDKWMLSKFAPRIILQIYLQSHCQHQHLRRLFMALGWGEQTSYMIKIVLFRGSNMDLKCILFFPLWSVFVPLNFSDLRFLTRQLQDVQMYQYDISSKGECYELSFYHE